MAGQVAPPAREIRGNVTITLPVSLIERMQRYTERGMRSPLVERALRDALDQAEAEQDAREHV